MAHTPLIVVGLSNTASANTAATYTAANVNNGATNNTAILLFASPTGAKIIETGLIVTEALTGNATLTVYVRPSPVAATTTNRRTVGTITLPTASSTIGDVVRLGNVPTDADCVVNPGEVVEINLTAHTGTAAGAGIPYLVLEPAFIGPTAEANTRTKPYRTNAIGSIKTVTA